MVLNFPTLNLQVGDTYNGPNGVLYTYDGVKWVGSTNVTSTIVNGNNVIQVDQSGDLVVPNGAMIIDQDGNPIQGFQGATGPTGPRGHDGSTGVQGPIGATGVTGAQGVSVTLQGTKATIADLPVAPLNANDYAGHGWIVTTGDGLTHQNGSLWFWNLTEEAWNDVGPIVGPQGDPGPQGEVGASGIDGATGFTGATGLRGFQGLDGATGPQGDPGATGLTGNEGATGATGPAGTDALWNFRGAYDNIASYAIGDVATYSGETWYRIDANYGEGGDIPVEGAFWTLLSQKGADGASGSGTDLGRYVFNGNQLYTSIVDSAYTTMYITPSGDGHVGITIPDTESAYNGAPLVINNNEDLGSVQIQTANGLWTFGSDGTLTAPYGKLGVTTGEIFGIVADADTAATIQSSNGAYVWGFGIDGVLNLPESSSENIAVIRSDQSIQINANNKYWSFAVDGVLTLPENGDIVDVNGTSVLGGGSGPSDRLVSGDYEVTLDSDGVLTLASNGAGITWNNPDTPPDPIGGWFATANIAFDKDRGTIISNGIGGIGGYSWIFGKDGTLDLPDGGEIWFSYGYIDQDTDEDSNALRVSGGNGVTIKAGEDTSTWRFNNDGSITFPDNTVQTTAFTGFPDLVVAEETAPESGILWFNTNEARMYIKYNEQWVDASPTVLPPPETNPTFESVTFNDATVQTTAWTGTYSYNDLTDKPVTPTFVGGGGASTWLTAD